MMFGRASVDTANRFYRSDNFMAQPDDKKPYTGLWIPRVVLEDASLSKTAKLVFAMVDALDNQDGCWASNEYIAKCLGIHPRYVRVTITELVKNKYLTRTMTTTGNNQTSRVLRVHQQAISASAGGHILPKPEHKTSSNSTSNNKSILKGGSDGKTF